MARFLINFVTFAACLAIAIVATFYLSCWIGIIALILTLFLAERAGLLR
jgi:hypothetical protein